jgi:transglutaminase-like putative cysteine protease
MIFTPYGFPEISDIYLESTSFLDCDDPVVIEFARRAVASETDNVRKAVRLFYAVRDGFRYDPFAIWLAAGAFRASTVIKQGYGFCITKAVLLAAVARASGIPAAIGLSDVVNHFTSEKLKAAMGHREVFIHHGYAALYLDGKWIRAAPAFNIELCNRFGVPPTEFDGRSDAILQKYDAQNNVRMEYLRDHGFWSDLPFNRVKDDMEGYYPAGFNYGTGGSDARFVSSPSVAEGKDR